MADLKVSERNTLEESFPGRVTFEQIERKIYSHDIAEMPRVIKPLVGDTLAKAVVQPVSEEELIELVTWSKLNEIPLTPRGKATSGYGGVLPLKQGIVVDFYRLNKIVAIDKDALTVTVQAGMVWERLDKELKQEGLTLRLYPTSYMASTVGGWLAQGGSGIGSYEAGWFRDNVISARVTLPAGDVREFSGEDLDVISDAQGITGLISQVTLRIQPDEEIEVVAIGSKTPQDLQTLYKTLIEEDLPIWSLLFINSKMAELKGQAPPKEAIILPQVHITTLAYRKRDDDTIQAKLPNILARTGSERLSHEIAHHEWENRFKVMLVKRLGPSLIPAEFVIPLDRLGDVMDEISQKVDQPIVKEGILVRSGSDNSPEIVILGFIPSDQRRLGYPLMFALSLSILKIAEKHGGRCYASGLYFSGKTPKLLGRDRYLKLKHYKQDVDPGGLMNPGKVVDRKLVSRFVGIASAFEPIGRILGNLVRARVGVRINGSVRGVPADVVWHAYSCSQCGYCIDDCDQFYGRGWESQSPRGKWYWLREYMEGREKWNQRMVDTILACTTCELCNLRCSENLPIESSWLKLRGKLIHEEEKMTFPPFEMMSAALQKEGNIWAGYRENRMDWFPEDLKEKHGPGCQAKTVYFAGCTASYVENDIGIATTRLLDEAGVDFTCLGNDENCCGTPMLVAGKWDVFRSNMERNIQLVKDAGADTVISSCPACDMIWRHVYPDWAKKWNIEYGIQAKHYSEVVTEKIQAGDFQFPENGDSKEKVTWHDSCHIGRVSGVYEPPRDLIKAIPGTELKEMTSNRENGRCCGSVLTLIKEPVVAADVGGHRLDEAVDAGVQKVLALCPCCEFQLRVSADKKNIPVEVVDLARYSAEALGYELPDPNPEVMKQWAVFEAMIALMSPQGFADLMGTMWPELIDAMPLGMGSMMRVMGKVPLVLDLMKPLFPILFPILLPRMMPKVLPTMLERIRETIPMPVYMEEQMPDMMPQIMDNLMPHMIGDLVPLVADPMIRYLRGKSA